MAVVLLLAFWSQVVAAAWRHDRVGDAVRRVAGRGVPVLIGWAVIVVALDWSLGSLWEVDETEVRGQRQGQAAPGQIPRDPRADGPAMEGIPWADDYFAELTTVQYEYSPYTIGHLGTTHGAYINTEDGVRRSYVPEAARGDDAVEVWFFGGSTMFGEGQRDEHTIPSELARLAEADGIPVRPVNFGHQGADAWQGLHRFERELARRGAPDVVVFYDGTNDFNAQLENPSSDPTHYDVDDISGMLSGSAAPIPQAGIEAEATLWQDYEETSFFHKLARRLGFEGTADASPTDQIEEVVPPEEIIDETREVYLRMVELAGFLARDADAAPRFFWQPVQVAPGTPYRIVAESLPRPVVDLSAILDDPPSPVFIDGGHTNELGALLVAEAVYDVIEADLRSAAP
jgi:lysophospholipase L1-like esterase